MAKPGSDSEYLALVHASVLQRIKPVTAFSAPLFLAYGLLDQVIYPHLAATFLPIRIAVTCLIFSAFIASYFVRPGRWANWLADFPVLVGGLGIISMVYLSNGSRSEYYDGLNVCFLAMFTMNQYVFRHNLVTGLALIVGYLVAVVLNGTGLETLASPLFFLGSTFVFVLMLTRLFARQHYREYVQTKKLAAQAEALDSANRALRESEKLKDELFANVSHELRTPLTLVLGPARKHLNDPRLSQTLRRDLHVIERNATLLLRHVNDLLDISRLESRQLSLELGEIDLQQLVKLICSHFETVAAEQGVRLTVRTETVHSSVDSSKIERILFNLLSNAVKFTPPGGGIVCELKGDAEAFSLVVSDTGPGIPDDKKQVIFQRFRQGNAGDTRRYGGTGLGLTIVREFARLHGGDVHVENGKPLGAVFTVRIPLRTGAESRQGAVTEETLRSIEAERPAPLAVVGVAAPPGGATVLVVEDNPEMNRFLTDALQPHYHVLQAYDGAQGLQMARASAPDLVLSDVMMPDMSGEQLMTALRQERRFDTTPLILLTAKADPALRESMLSRGAQDYLCKPFSVIELLARVQNLVAIKQARDVMEAELAVRNESLAEMAKALTSAKKTAETSLQAANDAARSRDEFLMVLSHELRTPLAAVLGWAEMIHKGIVPLDEIPSGIEIIERNARAQLRLVSDLLDASKSMLGKLPLERANLDLNEVTRAALQAIVMTTQAKRQELSVTIPTDPIWVYGDSERLRQILWNLLSNAVKFTPPGGSIQVTVDRVESGARIQVKDSGDGIDPAFLPQLFGRLRQEDSSTKRRFEGLGLGLAIVRHLVEAHGGRIRAESEGKDKGALFVITLPISEAPSTAASVPRVKQRADISVPG